MLLQLPGYSIQHSPCSAGPRSEVAPAQSLGTLCYALQCTGYLLELGIEWNYFEFVVLPKAITLTEYRVYFKRNFCITFPVITGLCGHSIWLAPVHRAYEFSFCALMWRLTVLNLNSLWKHVTSFALISFASPDLYQHFVSSFFSYCVSLHLSFLPFLSLPHFPHPCATPFTSPLFHYIIPNVSWKQRDSQALLLCLCCRHLSGCHCARDNKPQGQAFGSVLPRKWEWEDHLHYLRCYPFLSPLLPFPHSLFNPARKQIM